MADTIWLQRPSGDVPWGFRISGGRDYQEPVKVSRVTGGSIASTGLTNGDVLLRIGEADTSCLTQAQANDIIKNSGNLLQLCVSKGGNVQSPSYGTPPTGGQVADPNKNSDVVHGLFQDMYRCSDPVSPRSSSDIYNQGRTNLSNQLLQLNINNNYKSQRPIVTSSPKPTTRQPSPFGCPPYSHDNNTNSMSNKLYSVNSTNIKADTCLDNNQNNQTVIQKNYKPEASLNSSTDSGVSVGQDSFIRQNSNLSNSLSYPEPSFSSSTSESSDNANLGTLSPQSLTRDTSPSPPLPPPPINIDTFPGNLPVVSREDDNPSFQLPLPPTTFLPEPSVVNGETFDKPWKKNKEYAIRNGNPSEFSPRIDDQLSSMSINRHPSSQPTTPYSPYSSSPGQTNTPHSPYTPSQSSNPAYSPYTPTIRGYQSPGVQQNYHSPTTAPGGPSYHPLANVAPPPAPPPPMENNYSPYSSMERRQRQPPQPVQQKPAMPDAVLNMAAKGQPDKKPFAYAADMNEIKEHREKVRRKPVGIPSYQNILNLPQFEEKPRTYNPAAVNKPAPQISSNYQQGPGEGVYKHTQYNSPLGLYSSNTAEEAFVGQTEGLVTNVKGKEEKIPQIRLPGTKETKDITESETYKMIHGLNAPKERPKIVVPAHSYQGRQPRQPAPDDEMTFSGVIRPDEIPSKSFHRLQSLTDSGEPGTGNVGGSEIDTTSLRHMHHLGDDEGVGGYDEASIRYLGKNIPSKSFRMLQSMTGGTDNPVQATPKRRPVRRREDAQMEEAEKHDDEIVDISYVGGNIPSRSFKMLQQSIGEPHDNASQPEEGSAVKVQTVRYEPPSPEIQHQPPTPTYEPPTENRRQRRRQRTREINDNQTPERQFDENAYLSGQVQIVSGSVNNPKQRPRTQLSIDLSHSSQPKQEEEEEHKPHFDEQAFLTGRLPIVTGEAKPWSPKQKQFHEKAPWEREENQGRPVELFQEEPFKKKGPVQRERAPWERSDDETTGREKLASINYRKEVEKERAPWEKGDYNPEHRNFDENSFLRRRPSEPIEQNDEEPPISNGMPFDESSFLQGRVQVVSDSENDTAASHSNSTEEMVLDPVLIKSCQNLRNNNIQMDDGIPLCNGQDMSLSELQEPTKGTQYKKPAAFRERAPWEKSENELEQESFNEKEFLMGRVPLVNSTERRSSQGKTGRFNNVPSKTFMRLTRSMSREQSPSLDTTSDYLSADDDDRSDPGLSTTDPRYVGHKIPSRTFLKLHRSMERRSAEPDRGDYFYDDFERPDFDDYNISKQIEDVTIEKKTPEVYLNHLRETMQETRIEPQAEATDF